MERMRFYECKGCKKVEKETELMFRGNEDGRIIASCPWCKSEDLEEIK